MENNKSAKHCGSCKFNIREENGYSNWTVEGVDIDCLKSLNPDFPVDAFYNECREGQFAENCPSFVRGQGVHIDVEHEEGSLVNYSNDIEIKDLLLIREKSQ